MVERQDSNQTEEKEWLFVIKPQTNFLDLNLQEIWGYRDLLIMFIKRDFIVKFKQTILGPAWFIIQPLMTTLVFTVIFGKVGRLPTDGIPHILYYMSGVLTWHYFADCLNASSNLFFTNSKLFGKVYFPRLIIPISVIISNLMKFGIQFMMFLGFILYYHFKGFNANFTLIAMLLPLLLLMIALLALGFGCIISSITVKYRDLQMLLKFGIQLAMYGTPVVVPLSRVQSWKPVILANPMTSIIETFRYGFLGEGVFEWSFLAYSFIFSIVICFLGLIAFNQTEKSFIDVV